VQVAAYEVQLNAAQILPGVMDVLTSGWITEGQVGEKLETAWKALTGQPHAVAVSSGQNALEIALRGLVRGRQGWKVIVPANAFSGDAAAVLRAACLPLFVDVDGTMQLDVEEVAACDEREIAGVIAVHIGGWINQRMGKLAALCRARRWFLIEDACHAHGSRLDGSPAGSWGDAAVFSFYATKVVTCGEGGMMVTPHEELAQYARRARNNGRDSVRDREAQLVAGDCRLSDILASIALHQTRMLPMLIAEREFYAKLYDQAIGESEEWVPLRVPGCDPNWYKYILLLQQGGGSELVSRLAREGIACSGRVYESAVYDQPAFVPWRGGAKCPHAEWLCENHVALPLFNGLGLERALYVQRSLWAVHEASA